MVNKLTKGTLTIDVSINSINKNMELLWNGKSVDLSPDTFLVPFFEEVITELKKQNYSLTINFFQLVYMNSSTINSTIFFVKKLIQEKIKSKIVYNKDLKWQELNFSIFKTFATGDGLFEIEDTHMEWKLS